MPKHKHAEEDEEGPTAPVTKKHKKKKSKKSKAAAAEAESDTDTPATDVLKKEKTIKAKKAFRSQSSLWWSELDKGLLERMHEFCKRSNHDEDSVYDVETDWVDWDFVSGPGLSPEAAKERWVKLYSSIPKRRNMVEILQAISRNFEGAKTAGRVLTPEKFIQKSRSKIKLDADPDKPTRPPTSFFLFTEESRAKYVKEHPDESGKEVAKGLGKLWRELSEKEKAKYVTEFKRRMADWHTQLEEYYESHPEAKEREAVLRRKKLTRKNEKFTDPDAPKEPRSAYNLYLTYKLKQLNSAPDDSGSNQDHMKVIGKLWTEMPDEEKQKWNKKLVKAKETFRKEWEAYVKTLSPEEQTILDREKTEKKKKKVSSKQKKVSAPKKPTAQKIFVEENKEAVKAAHPDMSAVELRNQLKQMYKDLDAETKGEYAVKCHEANIQYCKDMIEYEEKQILQGKPPKEAKAEAAAAAATDAAAAAATAAAAAAATAAAAAAANVRSETQGEGPSLPENSDDSSDDSDEEGDEDDDDDAMDEEEEVPEKDEKETDSSSDSDDDDDEEQTMKWAQKVNKQYIQLSTEDNTAMTDAYKKWQQKGSPNKDVKVRLGGIKVAVNFTENKMEKPGHAKKIKLKLLL